MNINLNNQYNNQKTAFSANLKGTAVRMAVSKSTEAFQIGEIYEILENIQSFGHKSTNITCGADGLVSVSNNKFGQLVHKFRLQINEKAQNPFLDLLKVFNTENRVLKTEYDLLDSVFKHTKNQAQKEAKYKLFNSYNIPANTKVALNSAARKNNVIPQTPKDQQMPFEKLKEIFLTNLDNQNKI